MTATTRTTRLFTVRMWQEEADEGQGQARVARQSAGAAGRRGLLLP